VASTVDGLISGLSTTDLINQLVSVEAAGQNRLRNKVKVEQGVVSAYQSVNSKLSALKTAADGLITSTLSKPWTAAKATSSDKAVTATAANGATSGELTFNVKNLANAQITTAKFANGSTAATTGNYVDISIDGAAATRVTIDPTKNTPQGVADAINAAGLAVKAAAITASDGTAVLQLTGTKTGTTGDFTVTGLTVTPANVTDAVDATIEVGDPLTSGYAVKSTTNTFTNLMPGVTLTATAVKDGVTVSVKPDTDSLASKMQALVDTVNNALTEISKQTAYDQTIKLGMPLNGNSAARDIQQDLLSTISSGATGGYGSFKKLGIELDKAGKLTFDRAKFIAAYEADPAGTESVVSTQLAKSYKDVATEADKTVTTLITGRNTRITDLNKQVSEWDIRLDTRKAALQRQFANLETSLSSLRNQSNWLAGQIASLG
jgi:flagellar hook-associated protein 2